MLPNALVTRAIPYAYRLVRDTGEVHLVRVVDASEHVDDAAMIEI